MIRPTARTLKREKTTGGELSKPTCPLDIILKTVSDQPHIVKNVAYGLPFYGIVWNLVRQGPFMDKEFGHDYLGQFGNWYLLGRGSYLVEASQFS